MQFLVRLIINAAALWVAVRVVSGISYQGSWIPFFGVALLFGALNAVVRPILKLLTLPLLLLTLGLFTFVINGIMLWLTAGLARSLGVQFYVSGFWAAFWGALVVSVVSTILSWFVASEETTVLTR